MGGFYSKEKPCGNAIALQRALTPIESLPVCQKTGSVYMSSAKYSQVFLEARLSGLQVIIISSKACFFASSNSKRHAFAA